MPTPLSTRTDVRCTAPDPVIAMRPFVDAVNRRVPAPRARVVARRFDGGAVADRRH